MRLPTWWSALSGLVLILLGACGDEENGAAFVTMVIAADANLEARVDRLELQGEANTLKFTLKGAAKPGSKRVTFPFDAAALLPEQGRRTVHLRAYEGSRELVRRTVVLLPGTQTRPLLGIYLSAACEGRFEACDDADASQTCIDCGGRCEANTVRLGDLPTLDGDTDAVEQWQAPRCEDQDSDGGGRPEDASMADAEIDAGKQSEAGPEDSGSDGPDGTSPDALAITAAAVVASDGCIAVNIARTGAEVLPADLSVLSASLGTFHGDAECSTKPDLHFSAGQTNLTVYYRAPQSLSDGVAVASTVLQAKLGATSADRTLAIRLRAINVARGIVGGCVQLVNGSLYCFGDNSTAGLGRDLYTVQPVPRKAAASSMQPSATSLRSESSMTCLLEAGALQCFGANGYTGALGVSGFNDYSSYSPKTPDGLETGVSNFDPGGRGGCAVKSDHSLWCWGDNSSKACANDEVVVKVPAVRVSALDGITGEIEACAMTGAQLCAQLASGDAYCWGRGSHVPQKIAITSGYRVKKLVALSGGLCLLASKADSADRVYCGFDGAIPQQILGLPDLIDDIATQGESSCARAGNQLWCWGANTYAWLGTSSTATNVNPPSQVPLPAGKLSAFAMGWSGGPTLSAIIDGLVYSWGFNGKGVLGTDSALGVVSSPTPISVLEGLNVTEAQFGEDLAGCAIHDQGVLSCWGSAIGLGNGATSVGVGAFSNVPVTPLGLTSPVSQVEMGYQFVLALQDSKVYAWGYSEYGQLGLGPNPPVQVASPARASAVENLPGEVVQLAATYYRACARMDTGEVWCWGSWPERAQPILTPLRVLASGATDLSMNDDRSCAVVAGAVKCWSDGQFVVSTPVGLESGIDGIDLEGSTFCLSAGKQAACGFSGSLPSLATITFAADPNDPRNLLELRAGAAHACVLRPNQTLSCAGANDRGQLGRGFSANATLPEGPVPNLVAPVTRFDVSSQLACAQDSEGWKCWGDNSDNNMSLAPWVRRTPTLIAPYEPN